MIDGIYMIHIVNRATGVSTYNTDISSHNKGKTEAIQTLDGNLRKNNNNVNEIIESVDYQEYRRVRGAELFLAYSRRFILNRSARIVYAKLEVLCAIVRLNSLMVIRRSHLLIAVYLDKVSESTVMQNPRIIIYVSMYVRWRIKANVFCLCQEENTEERSMHQNIGSKRELDKII